MRKAGGARRRTAQRMKEAQARAMTRLANRTFATNPNRLDRLAMALLAKAFPPDDDVDPELDHTHLT